jgi:hypothetical protein
MMAPVVEPGLFTQAGPQVASVAGTAQTHRIANRRVLMSLNNIATEVPAQQGFAWIRNE